MVASGAWFVRRRAVVEGAAASVADVVGVVPPAVPPVVSPLRLLDVPELPLFEVPELPLLDVPLDVAELPLFDVPLRDEPFDDPVDDDEEPVAASVPSAAPAMRPTDLAKRLPTRRTPQPPRACADRARLAGGVRRLT